MSQMTYEQHSLLHQFLHPEKSYPTLDEAAIAGTAGTPVEMYRQIKAQLAAATRRAAEELLADPDFAARVDRLPFTPGSTVIGLGDSITDDLNSWLEILRNLLAIRRPQENIRVINAGVSGDTTTDVIRRFMSVAAENPAWIICMIGTNDTTRHGNDPLGVVVSPAETEKNLALMRHYAATQTSAQWVWITPWLTLPEKLAAHWFLGTLQIAILNEDMRAAADAVRRQPDPVLDLHKVLGNEANPDFLLDDGLHPSLTGQKRIVRALVEQLA